MDRNEERSNDFDRITAPNPSDARDLDASTSKPAIDSEVGDRIGEGVGGVSGLAAGAAIGSLGGPIGAIIGGIAGAASGWWAGHEISQVARDFEQQEGTYRTLYESSPHGLADRSFDDVRPAYQLGYLASQNPDYSGRSFEEIEPELQRGWSEDVRAKHGDWQTVRGFVREVYSIRRSAAGAAQQDRAFSSESDRHFPRPDDQSSR